MLISNHTRRRLHGFAEWLKGQTVFAALAAQKIIETVLLVFFPSPVARAVAWTAILVAYMVNHVWRDQIDAVKEEGTETLKDGAEAVTDAVDGDD